MKFVAMPMTGTGRTVAINPEQVRAVEEATPGAERVLIYTGDKQPFDIGLSLMVAVGKLEGSLF
jgi:hypothetical protein